jgi:hypothetical protein
MSNYLTVFVVALILSSNALAVTLEFSQVPAESLVVSSEGGETTQEFSYQGFEFSTHTGDPNPVPFLNSFAGGSLVAYPGEGAGFTMSTPYEELSGGNYDYGHQSFDFYGFEASYFPDPYNLTVMGYEWDSYYQEMVQVVSETIFINGNVSHTVSAPNTWKYLSMLEFSSGTSPIGGVVVRSISVSAVPIPAAVWLFGSALAGLGWMRRKQAA